VRRTKEQLKARLARHRQAAEEASARCESAPGCCAMTWMRMICPPVPAPPCNQLIVGHLQNTQLTRAGAGDREMVAEAERIQQQQLSRADETARTMQQLAVPAQQAPEVSARHHHTLQGPDRGGGLPRCPRPDSQSRLRAARPPAAAASSGGGGTPRPPRRSDMDGSDSAAFSSSEKADEQGPKQRQTRLTLEAVIDDAEPTPEPEPEPEPDSRSESVAKAELEPEPAPEPAREAEPEPETEPETEPEPEPEPVPESEPEPEPEQQVVAANQPVKLSYRERMRAMKEKAKEKALEAKEVLEAKVAEGAAKVAEMQEKQLQQQQQQ
jgi:hypothetical protein